MKTHLFASHSLLYVYLLVTATSSGILKAKQKPGRTFNSDKLGGIDFTKISKLTMCSVGSRKHKHDDPTATNIYMVGHLDLMRDHDLNSLMQLLFLTNQVSNVITPYLAV